MSRMNLTELDTLLTNKGFEKVYDNPDDPEVLIYAHKKGIIYSIKKTPMITGFLSYEVDMERAQSSQWFEEARKIADEINVISVFRNLTNILKQLPTKNKNPVPVDILHKGYNPCDWMPSTKERIEGIIDMAIKAPLLNPWPISPIEERELSWMHIFHNSRKNINTARIAALPDWVKEMTGITPTTPKPTQKPKKGPNFNH